MSQSLSLVSVNDAAKHYGIDHKTLRSCIDRGEVPVYRFGRVIRVDLAQLDAVFHIPAHAAK